MRHHYTPGHHGCRATFNSRACQRDGPGMCHGHHFPAKGNCDCYQQDGNCQCPFADEQLQESATAVETPGTETLAHQQQHEETLDSKLDRIEQLVAGLAVKISEMEKNKTK